MSKSMYPLLIVLFGLALLTACGASDTVSSGVKWDQEVDYLIVGGGIAGLSSAIEASDVGIQDILILEKTSRLGGAAFISGGILGGYDTQVTKAIDLYVDVEDIIAEQMLIFRQVL